MVSYVVSTCNIAFSCRRVAATPAKSSLSRVICCSSRSFSSSLPINSLASPTAAVRSLSLMLRTSRSCSVERGGRREVQAVKSAESASRAERREDRGGQV